jgi:hypothetical protein
LADRSFQKLMNLAFKKFTEVHVMYIRQWNCAKREPAFMKLYRQPKIRSIQHLSP